MLVSEIKYSSGIHYYGKNLNQDTKVSHSNLSLSYVFRRKKNVLYRDDSWAATTNDQRPTTTESAQGIKSRTAVFKAIVSVILVSMQSERADEKKEFCCCCCCCCSLRWRRRIIIMLTWLFSVRMRDMYNTRMIYQVHSHF